MKIFIRGTGTISPQPTFRASFLTEKIVSYEGNRLRCIEPDYKGIIEPKLIRRMSRIIRMGVSSAIESLQEANVEIPDAIITGTAYGCLEDTIVFLKKMIENNEEMLSPAAFIQSTHNTVGAQISLLLKCYGYNNTYTHRGFSFESALLDAVMLIKEQEAVNVLVGGIDEITDESHAIQSRFDLFKEENISNLDLYESKTLGTINGEGSSYFVLSGEKNEFSIAEFTGARTFYKPNRGDIGKFIDSFLADHDLLPANIDLIISGRNGNLHEDVIYNRLDNTIFRDKFVINYKHLCGEYPTSTSFAMWLGVQSIKNNLIPFNNYIADGKQIKNVLIYNEYLGIHHSLILLSAC